MSEQQQTNRFDDMMFGKRQSKESTVKESEESKESFDFFQTIQLVNDTYQKLSPLKKLIKNPFK
ncbi:hypothetical protein [Gracilibacillus kekensis]|uniref:Uncharacterized protein n=1 Tax=Gracilibacillus kekensis TaxID=1027249 RepID=A0A1M7INW9_9BACI|nr:hypothetical protein [Gracilibacillus kekensis]SHM42420.1 hypothetical protein SAMN05216179_0110 [Gracilibacillus kekensis]